MFILDSLFMSGFRWVLDTVVTAAEAERDDDTALREQLLEAEMRREIGEISDDEFAELEADVLARIREIKERRGGGSGPLAFGGNQPMETSPDSRFQIEATVSGDFHEPQPAGDLEPKPLHADEDSGTIIEGTLVEPAAEGGALAASNRPRGARGAGPREGAGGGSLRAAFGPLTPQGRLGPHDGRPSQRPRYDFRKPPA